MELRMMGFEEIGAEVALLAKPPQSPLNWTHE
jgi:hypothetical protein